MADLDKTTEFTKNQEKTQSHFSPLFNFLHFEFNFYIQPFLHFLPDGKQSKLVASFHAVLYVTVCE